MTKKSKFSIPAALALFVVTAHPESPSKDKESGTSSGANSTSSQQTQLSLEQRNQQSSFDPQRVSDTDIKKQVTDLNKASAFTKMTVQNMQNEKLGTVNDLVFDPESGRISYAVISVGGVLGLGDKLVAVPLTSLRAQPGQNHLVLNMTADELKSAPGLAKNSWPKLNDPSLVVPASSEKSSASSSSSDPSSSSNSSTGSSGTTNSGSSASEKSRGGDKSSSSGDTSGSSSKSSDQLSSASSDPSASSSTSRDKNSSSSAKDAQGSSPSGSSSNGSSTDGTETSGKDAGATGLSESPSSNPKI